jgi:hypothetical protein
VMSSQKKPDDEATESHGECAAEGSREVVGDEGEGEVGGDEAHDTADEAKRSIEGDKVTSALLVRKQPQSRFDESKLTDRMA